MCIYICISVNNVGNLQLKITTHQKCVTNFVLLQLSGPRPWYFLKHHYHDSETNMDCVRGTFASPEGNSSLFLKTVYDTRCVNNTHRFFTVISRL